MGVYTIINLLGIRGSKEVITAHYTIVCAHKSNIFGAKKERGSLEISGLKFYFQNKNESCKIFRPY